MEDDKQDHTQHSLHGQVTMAHSINASVPPTPPDPYLSSPIHAPPPPPMPLSNQWEVTGGTWLKVNVCRGRGTYNTYKDTEGKKHLVVSFSWNCNLRCVVCLCSLTFPWFPGNNMVSAQCCTVSVFVLQYIQDCDYSSTVWFWSSFREDTTCYSSLLFLCQHSKN